MGVPVAATRVSLRAEGEEAETPLRMTLELPGDDIDHAVTTALEAFGRVGALHPAVERLTVVAHTVEPPSEEKPEDER